MADKKTLTEAEKDQVRTLFESGRNTARKGHPAQWSMKTLAEHFGVSRWEIEKVTRPRSTIERQRFHVAQGPRSRPPAPIDDDPRSFTGRWFGDPMPGRSALDQKRQANG